VNDIIWLGPIINDKYFHLSKEISPAANLWQKNFLENLITNDISVTILTYLPKQSWPKGPLWVKYPAIDFFIKKSSIYTTSYINLPIIREIHIAISLYIKVPKSKQSYILFTYNPLLRHRLFVSILKFFKNAKWYSIIADGRILGRPDTSIFLSYNYFSECKLNNSIHFDGGIIQNENNYNKNNKDSMQYLLYAGSITKWTGILDFAEKYNLISDTLNYELHIYGSGEGENKIKKLSSLNSKIKYYGFVKEDELFNACQEAFAFINPRPLNVIDGEKNFPSKILFYFSFQKPVISTLTLGLSKDYLELLVIYDENNIIEFIQCLKNIENLKVYERYSNLIKNYVTQNTWKQKIKQLLNEIEKREN
jgi:glycosyltransferase involved in cell wall biosynthesis